MACHELLRRRSFSVGPCQGLGTWACRRLDAGSSLGALMTGHRGLVAVLATSAHPLPLVREARGHHLATTHTVRRGRPTQHLMRIAAHQADSPLLLEAGAEAPGEAGAHASASASPDIAPSVRRSGASPSASVRGGSCSALSCFEGSG